MLDHPPTRVDLAISGTRHSATTGLIEIYSRMNIYLCLALFTLKAPTPVFKLTLCVCVCRVNSVWEGTVF